MNTTNSQRDNQSLSIKDLAGIFTSAKGYTPFLKAPIWQLVALSLLAILICSFVWTVKVVTKDLPSLRTNLEQSISTLDSSYPSDLEISWDGSSLSTTPTGIQSLPFPEFINADSVALPKHVLTYVPDTFNPESTGFDPETSLLIIDSNQIYVQSQGGEWTNIDLTEVLPGSEFNFNQETLINSLQNLVTSDQTALIATVSILLISPLVIGFGMIWNGFTQWLLTYVVITKLYSLPMSGQDLARLAVPLTFISSLLFHISTVLYGATMFPIFGVTYWVVLLLVIQSMKIIRK